MSRSITGEFSAIGGNQLSMRGGGVARRVSLTLVVNDWNFNRISLSHFFRKEYALRVVTSKPKSEISPLCFIY